MATKTSSLSKYDPGDPDEGVVLFVRGLRREDRAKFKAICAVERITMTDKILSWIHDAIAADERAGRPARRGK